ncbi:MAG: hypothetical protein ACU83V_13090, partial [Gammaproteobacteria bacterium]
ACITSNLAGPKNNQKLVTYPGKVHVGHDVKNDSGSCWAVGSIKYTIDPTFDYLMVGNGANARYNVHTFAGNSSSFYPHTGYPLTELSIPKELISRDGQELTVNLSNYDIEAALGLDDNCANGELPDGFRIYGRAHAFMKEDQLPGNRTLQFSSTSDSLTPVTVDVIENPVQGCTDGEFDTP